MALGPFCKALGIDEEVLLGQKAVVCDVKTLTNGVMWELKKYKTAKKVSLKDFIDWIRNIFQVKCENSDEVQGQLNDKLESLSTLRNTLTKSPNRYRGEMERLNNWQFDFPASMGVEPAPTFELTVPANLGPKLLKVLKEKGGDDDEIDMSGDDDEQAKKRKAREEIVHLKRDLGSARKIITALNEKMSDLNKRCQVLTDMSKTSVSERRHIESDILKLKMDWHNVLSSWHDCMERLNHVNNNKGNYLDVGYMVRRNKTKQGIFDELNLEFEKTLEEFKHKISSLIDKERRKKKVVSREYRQKSKTDRKRVRLESEENDDSKKPCLSEEALKQVPSIMPVDEFLKFDTVDEFKGGKFLNAIKAIYLELTSSSSVCSNVHEIIVSVLDILEPLNTDKIPSQAFAGNIFMEARMAVFLQMFSDLLQSSKVSVSNDGSTIFTLINGTDYEVKLPDDKKIILGVRDISNGSPDTSLSALKDLLNDMMSTKPEGNAIIEAVAKAIRSHVNEEVLLDKKLIEILFSLKQKIFPQFSCSFEKVPESYKPKCILLNNICTGVYFLLGLAKLADVTALAWESLTLGGNSISELKNVHSNQILSNTVFRIYSFCENIDPHNSCDISSLFRDFTSKEKKLLCSPVAPYKSSIFNVVFHNAAAIWYFHEVGILCEFLEKLQKEIKLHPAEIIETGGNNPVEKESEKSMVEENKAKEDIKTEESIERMEVDALHDHTDGESKSFSELFQDESILSFARALGLIGKLVFASFWTSLEDDVQISVRYAALLTKIDNWSKDATKFMKGQERLFEDIPVSHDAVYISLVKDNPTDAATKELLELLFTAFVPFVKSFMQSNKQGYGTINGDSSVDDSNVPIHKDFRKFDQITMNIHSISHFAFDALTLYSKRNGTWQDKLSNKESLKVFDLIEQDYNNKQMKILYQRKIALTKIKETVQGQKKDMHTKSQLIENRYKLISDLIKWGGLWKSEKEIEAQVKDMKESDRMNAFRAQIRFRRHILGEGGENGLLDLASEGECFNAEKLQENLRAILKRECEMTETNAFELASATNDEKQISAIYDACNTAQELKVSEFSRNVTKENFHWLLGKLLRHSFMLDHGKADDVGVCIARKKMNGMFSYFIRYKNKGVFNVSDCRIAEDFKNHSLKIIDPSVTDLIGSRLSRAFIKDDGDLEWHDCKVIGATSNGSDFVVEFDCYEDSVQLEEVATKVPDPENFTFIAHLLDDYKNDHLRLL